MTQGNGWSRTLFLIAVVVFGLSLLSGLMGWQRAIGPLVIVALASTACGFLAHPSLKSVTFTAWVFTFVAMSMFYPGSFGTWFGVDLKVLIVPLIQVIMFGMGTTLSLRDFGRVLTMPGRYSSGCCCNSASCRRSAGHRRCIRLRAGGCCRHHPHRLGAGRSGIERHDLPGSRRRRTVRHHDGLLHTDVARHDASVDENAGRTVRSDRHLGNADVHSQHDRRADRRGPGCEPHSLQFIRVLAKAQCLGDHRARRRSAERRCLSL